MPSTTNGTLSTTTASSTTNAKEEENGAGFRVGTILWANWMGQTERTCVVIDRKLVGKERFKYYVHWHDFNRRMDEWINESEVIREGTEEETKRLQEKHAHRPTPAANASGEGTPAVGTPTNATEESAPRTRGHKRKAPEDSHDEFAPPDEHDEHEGMDAASIREHEEVTKVKNVRFVEIGRFRMAAWYFSPFPKEYFPDGQIDCLYFCEFCMGFFCHKRELSHHQEREACSRHPPGNEIYRHENLSVFEVDGAVSKIYCQNLCYLAKLFLDHKTLYYDVDPFLFYIVCEVDNRGFHPVGYFSKEKYSELGYNLACILTFPCHQRKGYGNFIIQFSYELSKKEEKVGSPEKPLSDLGLVSYRSYWTKELLKILRDYPEKEVSIMELTRMTSIKNEDIIATLQYLNMIKYFNGQYVFVVPKQILDEQLNKVTKKGPQVLAEKLHWAPLHLDIKRDKWSLKSKSADKED
ncbi:hypothetical protein Poli38472_005689 [Pythium oligandrum]|uniref:histone acetyltransferase n=1 Tax=Pythium oligandrum TaxID=41045 RepID=A0A8K1CHV6_PYTOL|nr:hypothetical protein Poli38472_005689 [Pythium oligandrum]|eukprot:TMW63071.1 hypothetical protein Poli38472_005689 [Pythium oligandrum]